MKIRIYYSSHFEKAFRKLPRLIQKKAILKEKIFRKDYFDTRLYTHKLKGELASYWSLRIDYHYRILLEFQEDGSISFIDIGLHSIYQ